MLLIASTVSSLVYRKMLKLISIIQLLVLLLVFTNSTPSSYFR